MITEAQLRELYINKNMTLKEIQEKTGVSAKILFNRLKKFNIPARPAKRREGTTHTEETLQKMRTSMRGIPKSEEHKRKLSLARMGDKNPNFGKKPKRGKRHWYQCPNGQYVSMRSTWEVLYAEYLTKNNFDWEYEPKTFILSSGEAYTPDFYIKNINEWVEVKGWLTQEHKRKMDEWKVLNPNGVLVLADRKYLISIGIDLKEHWISSKPTFPCLLCGEQFHRKYPQQQLCSVRCRNKFIANDGKLNLENKEKRTYNGSQSGEKNNGSKLTEKDAIEIIEMRKSGQSLKKISEAKNISIGNIGNIIKGRSWKYLTT